MSEGDRKKISPEMQVLVNAAVKSRSKLRLASKAYNKQLQIKLEACAELLKLKIVAAAANEEYAKLWQVTKEFLPKEE